MKLYARRCAAALASVLVVACSLTVESDRVQCSKDADCAGRGAQFVGSICIDSMCQPEPRWSCIGVPPPAPVKTEMYEVTFLLQHLLTQMPLPGVSARICRKIDVNCLDSMSETLTTDGSGRVTFKVMGGFEGYARFERPDLIRGLSFFNPPVRANLPLVTISMASPEVVTLLAQQVGATQDPKRGVVLLVARDCTGTAAPGVTLNAIARDPLAIPFYSERGLPSATAQTTDVAGYGGLLNAAPGSVTFSASIAATEREFGEVTLLVQEGAITYGTVVPDGR